MRQLHFAPAAARVGFGLAICYLLWLGSAYFGLVLFPLNVLSLGLMLVGLGAWFAWRVKRGRGFAQTPLDGALLLGLGAAALSAVFSIDPGRSAGMTWLGAVWVGVYWVIADALAEGLPRPLLARAIYLAGWLVILIGIVQVFNFWRGWLALGLLPPVSYRVAAPNPTANGLNFIWPLLLAEIFETDKRWLKFVMGVMLFSVAVTILYTSSRGGWLGMGVGIVIFALLKGETLRRLARRVWVNPLVRVALSLVALGLAFGVIALAVRQMRHATHGATLEQARGAYWDTAWQTFLRQPLTGQGLFTYGSAFLPVWPVPPTGLYNQAHGVIHNLLAETGLIGFAAAVFLLITFLRALKWPQDAWQVAALAALGTALGHSLFETPYVSPSTLVLAALMAALLMPATKRGWRNGVLLIPVAVIGVWAVWAYAPLHRGIELGNNGDWPAAQPQLAEAVRRDPLSTFAKFQAAYAAQRVGDSQRAVELYRAALPHEPGYSINWANFAAAQWANGDHAGALASLAQAHVLAPPAEVYRYTESLWRNQPAAPAVLSADELLDVRIAQAIGGRLAPAELQADGERLRAVFTRGAATSAQVLQLAEIELLQGNTDRAQYLSHYARATQDFDSAAMRLMSGDLAAAAGDTETAARWYAEAWAAYPPPDYYGPGFDYAWLLFVRESLQASLAPGLTWPPYPRALVERWRTLVEWQKQLGQTEAARAVEASLAARSEWGQ